MAVHPLVFALTILTLGGCASRGGEAPPPRAAPSVPSAGERPMSELLMPVGSARSAADLAAIGRLIRRHLQAPLTPLSENDLGLSDHAALMAWLVESPDVSVVVCPIFIAFAQAAGVEADTSAGTVGALFGRAAFQIEHPELDPSSMEVQAAGGEAGLLYYRSRVAANPTARDALMDRVAADAQEAGGMRALLDARGFACAP